MKKSHFWFMVEGIVCGVLQIVVWEFSASTAYAQHPWLRVAVPMFGVVLSTVGFFLLMHRYPGMKLKKYALGAFTYVVMLPAWIVYGSVFGLAIFPHRVLAAADYSAMTRLMGFYTLALIITRAVIVLFFFIRKKRRKRSGS